MLRPTLKTRFDPARVEMIPPRNADYDAPVMSETTVILDLVRRYSEWRIGVYCPRCIRLIKLDPVVLMKQRVPPTTIADLRRRQRCRECGRSDNLLIKPTLGTRRPARD